MKLKILLTVLMLLNFSFIAQGKIIVTDVTESLIFTPEKVNKEALWSSNLKITPDGLTPTDDNLKEDENFWVQTQPIGIGRSHNPFIRFGFTTLLNGEIKSAEYNGINLYFRYSCDREHWSSWYPLEKNIGKLEGWNETYKGFVSIPKAARERFEAMKIEWAKTKPVYRDDIHEFAKWIITQEPAFFAKEFPFVGYVQIRIEAENVENINLKQLDFRYTMIESGLVGRRYTIDENGNRVPFVKRRDADNPWFFTNKQN